MHKVTVPPRWRFEGTWGIQSGVCSPLEELHYEYCSCSFITLLPLPDPMMTCLLNTIVKYKYNKCL